MSQEDIQVGQERYTEVPEVMCEMGVRTKNMGYEMLKRKKSILTKVRQGHRKAEMEEAQGLWTVLVTDQWVEPSLRQVTNFLVKILSKVTLPFPSSN